MQLNFPRIDHNIGLLTKAPVVYSVVMVRFPVEQNLADSIGQISKDLKPDFLRANDRQLQSVRVSGNQVEMKAATEFVFHNQNRTIGFTLKGDMLFIHASIYPGFKDFSRIVKRIFDVVFDAAGITHFTTIGIRYIDAIIPEGAETLDFYVRKFLRNPSMELVQGAPSTSQTIHIFETAIGKLVLRTYRLANENCIPPDLQESAKLLKHKRQDFQVHQEFMVIDTDHIYTPEDPDLLNTESLVARLDAMHTYTTAIFKDAVTKEGLESWR